MSHLSRIAGFLVIAGCASSAPDPRAAQGPVAQTLESAAAEAGVPAELLAAIAVEEGGLQLPALRVVGEDDLVPIAGMLELRRGRLDTLALGAQLIGSDEATLRGDTDLATRAGARVLAQLGAQYGAGPELASWRRAVEVMAGMDELTSKNYASRVFAIVRGGGAFPARDGEVLQLPAHLEVPVGETIEDTARLAAPSAAEFPGAQWFTTSCTSKCTVGRPLGHASVNKIVIHDTEGGWNSSVATLQNDPDKSVHYIIDADGSRVGQFRPEGDTTWHAGNFYYNETSVGIEHVGVAANPAGYSAALYAKSRQLVQSIRTRWTIPLDRGHIVGHYQVPDGSAIAESSAPCGDPLDVCETSARYGGAANHRDPGENWQWCQYMEALGGHCTCNDAWSHWNCTTDKTEAVRCVGGTVEIAHCTDACAVQAVGVDDVCHTAGGGGGGTPPPSGDGGGGTPGVDPPPAGETPPATDGGGCAVGGGGGSMLAIGLALLLIRRRAR